MRRDEVEHEYEKNTGRVIVETFTGLGLSPAEMPAVLVANHGPFTWGADAAKAIEHAQVLEYVARMDWHVRQIAPEAPRPDDFLVEKHYRRKHGPKAYYGQEDKL
jgi:L-ribulose-5-phosphate 4-epimerase